MTGNHCQCDHAREPDLRLEMFSQPRFLVAARMMVHQVAQRVGFTEAQASQISLAVDEALCNVIKHGYDRREDGRMWLNVFDLRTDPPGLKIIIEDQARQVDPTSIQSRDLDDIRPGGLGVYIIRAVMDEVTYEQRDGGGMRLTLVKQKADEPAEAENLVPPDPDAPHPNPET